MSEYQELTFEQLMVKAMDIRFDSGPLLEEAQRRDLSAIQELAAVAGKTVTDQWAPVGAITLDDGTHQIAVCMRLSPVEASTRFVQPEPTMRSEGGTFRDAGRA